MHIVTITSIECKKNTEWSSHNWQGEERRFLATFVVNNIPVVHVASKCWEGCLIPDPILV